MAARQFITKTPGAAHVPDEAIADMVLGADFEQEVHTPPLPSGPSALTMAPDLEAYIAREIAKGVANAMATNARANVVAAPAIVPDEEDINPADIKQWVLTKQGYVLPDSFGVIAAEKSADIAALVKALKA